MSRKLSPGLAPLGHSPMGKEKLEGPKREHDYHGKDASVPAKGSKSAIPNEQWERGYDPRPSGDSRKTLGYPFDPQKSTNRVVTYEKVNAEDH